MTAFDPIGSDHGLGLATTKLLTSVLLGSVLLSSQAAEAAITCDQFKERLGASIIAGGHRVAVPSNYSIAFKAEGDLLTRYHGEGIVGLEIEVKCVADEFHSVTSTVSFSESNLVELDNRIDRLLAFTAAAICVINPQPEKSCKRASDLLYNKVEREFLAEKTRGEPHPYADEFQDLQPHTQVDISLAEAGIIADVFDKDVPMK